MNSIKRLLKHVEEGEYWGELGEDAARELESLSTKIYALETVCDIINTCGFKLEGGSVAPEYILWGEKYVQEISNRYHTKKR